MSTAQRAPREAPVPGDDIDPPRRGSVTLVVIAYNHAPYVEQTLDTAFAQTYDDLRVLIFDDASPDDTADVIRAYLERTGADARFVAHETNQKLCATLNEALELVDTEFVGFISADDWMEPNRIDVQVRALDGLGPDYGLVYCDANVIGIDGRTATRSFIRQRIGSAPVPQGNVFRDLLGKNWIPTPGVLMRTAVFDVVGPYDEALAYDDHDMWLRIARYFEFAYVDEPLVTYRELPGSLVHIYDDDLDGYFAMVRQMLTKHLGIDATIDAQIHATLTSTIKALYQQGRSSQSTRRDLREQLPHDPTVSSYVYLAAATLTIPGAWVLTATSALRRVLGRGGAPAAT